MTFCGDHPTKQDWQYYLLSRTQQEDEKQTIPKSATVLSAHVSVEFHIERKSKESEKLMDIVGSKPFGLSFWVLVVPQYISTSTSIYFYRLLVDLRDTSQPKKFALELWFIFWFEILNECYLSKNKL